MYIEKDIINVELEDSYYWDICTHDFYDEIKEHAEINEEYLYNCFEFETWYKHVKFKVKIRYKVSSDKLKKHGNKVDFFQRII